MLQVRLLGQFDVRVDGKRTVIHSRKAQALFAFLVLTAGQAHRREHLIGVLWSELSEAEGRRHLRQELWRIRRALNQQSLNADEIILGDDFTLSLNAEAEIWLDTREFERAQMETLSLPDLVTKASLYRGELLPGFYEDWVALERERFAALYEAVMCDLMKQLVEAEHWHSVIEWAETWISISQSPEPAFSALMLAYSALCDPAKVFAAYSRCRIALQELGVTPSDETSALYTRLIEAWHPTVASSVHTILTRHRAHAQTNARVVPR